MENNEDKVETGHRGEVILQQPQHSASFESSTALLHILHCPTRKLSLWLLWLHWLWNLWQNWRIDLDCLFASTNNQCTISNTLPLLEVPHSGIFFWARNGESLAEGGGWAQPASNAGHVGHAFLGLSCQAGPTTNIKNVGHIPIPPAASHQIRAAQVSKY